MALSVSVRGVALVFLLGWLSVEALARDSTPAPKPSVLHAARHHELDTSSEVVRKLLEDGADVNETGDDNLSALHWAGRRGDVATIKLLLEAGADVNQQAHVFAHTPLTFALNSANEDRLEEVVGTLLSAGAEVNTLARSCLVEGAFYPALARLTTLPDLVRAVVLLAWWTLPVVAGRVLETRKSCCNALVLLTVSAMALGLPVGVVFAQVALCYGALFLVNSIVMYPGVTVFIGARMGEEAYASLVSVYSKIALGCFIYAAALMGREVFDEV